MRQIVLYSRISTDLQSLERQKAELLRYVTARFPDAEYRFVDEVGSGAKAARPEYQAILKDVRAGRVSHVIVCKLDRWSRSLKELLTTLEMLEQHNTKFISVNDDIDLSTPVGRLLVQMLGSIAEFERSLIVSRVKDGMAHAKSKGVLLGRKPLIIDRGKVQELRAGGMSLRKIAKAMDTSLTSVVKILKAS